MSNKENENNPVSDEKDTRPSGEIPPTTMDDLVSNEPMPEVNPDAINAVKEAVKDQANDPAPYGYKADGTPKKSPRGRKSKVAGAAPISSRVGPKPQGGEQEPQMSSIQAGTVVSGILERLQIVLISDDFIYTDQERAANSKAWADTFDHYGGVKISPPAALAMDHVAIILSRSAKPKTKDKLTAMKVYFAEKLSKAKFWKKENARIDSGTDSKRENDLREKESGQLKK